MNWAYIAGFFDGEGSLRVPMGQKYVTSPQVCIYQSDQLVLLRIQRFLAAHGIHSHVRKENRMRKGLQRVISKKDQYILDFSRKQSVTIFLRSIRPYAVVKKQIIEDCIRYLILFPAMTKQQREWRRMEGRRIAKNG